MGEPVLTRPAGWLVTIDDAPLTAADVAKVAAGARVELGPIARERIAASRAVVDGLVTGEALVYGLNTGLGHMRNQRVPMHELAASQAFVVRNHAGAIGPPLRAEIVRAAMAVRLAGIARGGAGASADVADGYVGLLNAGVTPVVPEIGSVGASDLGHMAAIALVLIGEGQAEYRGRVLPGAVALRRAGLRPVILQPKDGLTVVSANGLSIGHAALVIEHAIRLARSADAVVALSLEAARGNLSILDPRAAAAKPVPGQALAAARIRALLEGSRLCTGAPSVQDALSFRVAPQVHGAFREVVLAASAAVDGELAAMDDNPLVVADEGRMISNGNFHPMLMALAVDAVRPAIAHVAQLADRRIGHLWDALFSNPEFATPEGTARAGVAPLVRYSIAARAAELRAIAGPASLDIGPLDLGVEDHATNAPAVVRQTDAALGLLEDVLAGELMVAAASLRMQGQDGALLGHRTRRILELVNGAMARDAAAPPVAAAAPVAAAGDAAAPVVATATPVAATPVAQAHAAVRALLGGPLAEAIERLDSPPPAPPPAPPAPPVPQQPG